MDLMPIGQLSRSLNVSTRTLRYYEQIGLISSRKSEASYRCYDEEAVGRLQQILLLRKLRIPLAQIGDILQSGEARTALDAFRRSARQLDGEIAALSTIRQILTTLIQRMEESIHRDIRHSFLSDQAVMDLAGALSLSKTSLKEEIAVEELNNASAELSRIRSARIVYLPPSAVASFHHVGPECEHRASEGIERFIRDVRLWEIKPDMRSYGFNHPNEVKGTDYHGYEFWVTIPADMEVPAPCVKKHFPGGLYAAHAIKMGDFHEWGWLWRWVEESPDWEMVLVEDGGECMNGLLEECLNYIEVARGDGIAASDQSMLQLDLLIPIRHKST